MITSSTPGRLRVRHPALADAPLASAARERLLAVRGVTSVDHGARATSLLVRYDPAQTDPPALLAAAGLPHDEAGGEAGARGLGIALSPSALLVALAATVASGFVKLKTVHLVAGAFLCVAALRHVGQVRARAQQREPDAGARAQLN